MKIPIRNLYYLLSYVWDVEWELEWSSINAEKSVDALNLLTKILVVSTERIIRRGLDRGYKEASNSFFGIRGRIDIANTLKSNGFLNNRITCNFDELDYSVIHNQIIKSTLDYIIHTTGLDKDLREHVHDLRHRMDNIRLIRLTPNVFSNVRIHTNIQNYRIPISVCNLLYEQLLPTKDAGEFKFVDLSDNKLFKIFEKFLFKFYEKHINLTDYNAVKKERLNWQDTLWEDGMGDFLPAMETDVCLIDDKRRLIIECKYYKSALNSRYPKDNEEQGSFISAHLYQLYAYLKNFQLKDTTRPTSGMLLYPENGYKIDSIYNLQGHKVSIRTIDLEQNPQEIHNDLLRFLDIYNHLPVMMS